MSNVLIGIIGVILFIGLALAGALFLGPRFSDAKSTSTASSAIQAVSQISNAISYSNAEMAIKSQAGVNPSFFVASGYLKSVPSNPGGTDPIAIMSRNGEAATGDAALVVARLSTSAAGSTCGSIVRQSTNAISSIGADGYTTATSVAELPPGPAGCFKVGPTAINSLLADQFYAFARV
jgi:hypothetical protein